jgi:hypothetical protein
VQVLGLRFLAPGFLLLLVLPLAALWLGARGGAVRALVTGTLEAWRTAERNRPAQERRKRRVPPALYCLAAALASAALALARPERVVPEPGRRFTLVVDRSPSMYLAEGGRTRLERALAAVRAWSGSALRADDELVWIDALHPVGRIAREAPLDLLERPRAALPEPDWNRYERPGALWISDRFDALPLQAGFAASGGASVPGAIGREGSARLDWDGERVVRVEQAYTPEELAAWIDPGLPEPLRELARLWAESRGLVLREARGPGELFAFALVRAGEPRPAALALDGWSASARVADAPAPAAGESAWLVAGGPCVLRAPGSLRCSIVELDAPQGDPASFAVSWGGLFDSVLLEPSGVVPLGERTARGEPAWRAPADAGQAAGEPPRALAGACALLAALLVLGAWVLRGIRA